MFPMVFNPNQLDSWFCMLGNRGRSALAELIETYLTDTPRRLEQMRAELLAGDHRALFRSAHLLKTNCGNLGGERLMVLLSTLEQLCHSGTLNGASHVVRQLEPDLQTFGDALVSYCRDRLAT